MIAIYDGGGMRVANVVEKTVWEMAEQLLNGSGVELVDVEYVKEKDWYLRVFIDKPEGIGIEDCQALSEKLESLLDARDVVPDAYILEVSSPGLDRVLKKTRDFERERGKTVEVSLYEPLEGEKLLVGTLESFDGATFTLLAKTSMLPEGFSRWAEDGENLVTKAAAIKTTADGKIVMASNRGYDSIAFYEVGTLGKLKLRNIAKLRGKFPRDFELMPGEKFLVVGHKMSNEIQVYAFDRGKCTLEPAGEAIPCWRPLCFKFL